MQPKTASVGYILLLSSRFLYGNKVWKMHEDNKALVNSGRFSIFMDAQAMGFLIVYHLWFDVQPSTNINFNHQTN